MGRPVTLCTAQWTDWTLDVMAAKAAEFGFDGLELACWGHHVDVFKAAEDKTYCKHILDTLAKHNLKMWAISNHLAGQLVLDNNDHRTDDWVPADCRGDAEKKRKWAIEAMKKTGQAAKNLGVSIVNGFTGSPIWHYVYSFPPVPESEIEAGFAKLAELWGPILDEYKKLGVKFALEVHPTEIAFDIASAARALRALGGHEAFGFNYDPSHLIYQNVDYVAFIREFRDRIFHVHMKDCYVAPTPGRIGIFGGHTAFGTPGRAWDFRSLGRGSVDFEEIIRALNEIGYQGPLSVEWEDSGMDREHGAAEAAAFVKDIDFPPSAFAFDAHFGDRD